MDLFGGFSQRRHLLMIEENCVRRSLTLVLAALLLMVVAAPVFASVETNFTFSYSGTLKNGSPVSGSVPLQGILNPDGTSYALQQPGYGISQDPPGVLILQNAGLTTDLFGNTFDPDNILTYKNGIPSLDSNGILFLDTNYPLVLSYVHIWEVGSVFEYSELGGSGTLNSVTFQITSDPVQPAGGDDPPDPPPVPEPTTLAIWGLGLGLAGAASLRRRNQGKGRWSEESRRAIFRVIEQNR